MKLNFKNKLTTRDGNAIRIHTTKGEDAKYPIVGEIHLAKNEWLVSKWKTDGTCTAGRQLDLIVPRVSKNVFSALCKDLSTSRVEVIGGFNSLRELEEHVSRYPTWTVVATKTSKLTEGEFINNAGNSNI